MQSAHGKLTALTKHIVDYFFRKKNEKEKKHYHFVPSQKKKSPSLQEIYQYLI
jgi:hypothetical protein